MTQSDRAARIALYEETLRRVTEEEEAAQSMWWASVQEVVARTGIPGSWEEAHARADARRSLALGMERAYAAHRGIHHITDFAEGQASAAADLAYPIETPAWARGFLASFERRVSP